MSQSKHTPGEWEAAEHYTHSGATYTWEVCSPGYPGFVNVVRIYPEGDEAVAEMGVLARRVAVALNSYGDLLAACQWALRCYPMLYPGGSASESELLKAMQDAIAKATGEPQS